MPCLFLCGTTLAAVASINLLSGAQSAESPSPSSPPPAQIKPVVDEYYGNKISDPYRYMENLKDPDVQAWIKA